MRRCLSEPVRYTRFVRSSIELEHTVELEYNSASTSVSVNLDRVLGMPAEPLVAHSAAILVRFVNHEVVAPRHRQVGVLVACDSAPFVKYCPVKWSTGAVNNPSGSVAHLVKPRRFHSLRSEERRGGTECVIKCRSRWWP